MSRKDKQNPRLNKRKTQTYVYFGFPGTSNWSGDYFVHTAGSALVINQTSSESPEATVQSQLKEVFERDWNSAYSTPITQHSNHKVLCWFHLVTEQTGSSTTEGALPLNAPRCALPAQFQYFLMDYKLF